MSTEIKKKPLTPFLPTHSAVLRNKLAGLSGWRNPENQVVHKPTVEADAKERQTQPREHALA